MTARKSPASPATAATRRPARTTGDTFGERVFEFYAGLRAPRVPVGFEVMNPYRDRKVQAWVRAFLGKFYDDERQRVLVFGINPGRFGAGLTGVTFTDPVALADVCQVANDLPRRRELSSVFIHDAIAGYGGPGRFFGCFFLTAVSPLGFTKDGRNANYYDDAALTKAVTPFIERTVERQILVGGRRDHAILLGTGRNQAFFQDLNQRRGWFNALHVLEHPRFIMQYRRKRLDEYLARYVAVFAAVAPLASRAGISLPWSRGAQAPGPGQSP